MKGILRTMVIICGVCLAAWLTGCAPQGLLPEPDTVVQIPLHPAQAPTLSETDAPESAEASRPAAAEETAEATETQAASHSGKASGSGRRSSGSGKRSVRTGSSSQETVPPESTPLETSPPETPPLSETELPESTQAPADEQTQAEATAEPSAQSDEPYDISGYTAGSLEYAVLDQINACRAEAELAPLSMDERLCAIASARAFEISKSWSHTRPDGRPFGTVLADYGYPAGSAGEVLAYATAPSAAAIGAKWMENASTRDSLTGNYAAAGVGIYCAGGVTYLACLLVS